MAFTLANWSSVSTSLSQGQVNVTPFGGSATVENSPNLYTYGSPNDNVTAITASNYFLPQWASLCVGDLILGFGTDAGFLLQVTAVLSTSVTVVNLISGSGGGIGGSGTATQLAYFTSAEVIASNEDMAYDPDTHTTTFTAVTATDALVSAGTLLVQGGATLGEAVRFTNSYLYDNPPANSPKILEVGSDGAIGATSSISVVNLTAENFIQPYAPIASSASPIAKIDFFGDSVTSGVGATSNAYRWSTLLCAQLGGVTENNQAVPGSEWMDGISQVYGGITNAPLKIMAWGLNDLRSQDQLTELKKCAESLAVYACLKSSGQIADARAATVISGTWVNNPNLSIGLECQASGSIAFTTTGRYIVCGLMTTCLETIPLPRYINQSPTIAVTVNSISVVSGLQILCTLRKSINGCTYSDQLLFIDTNSAPGTVQNVVFNYGSVGSPYFGYIDWIGGFDKNQSGCTPVVIPKVYDANYQSLNIPQHYADTLNNYFKQIMFKFYNQLGLPIFYADNCGNFGTAAMLYYDGLHPNDFGHQYFANNMQEFLLVGAQNFFAT